MDWNDETILRLRSLWDEGHSTAEIGRRLGVSKNAVVGKAHRLGLPSRPSPIRREGGGRSRPASPRRVIGPTLPPLPADASAAAAPRRPEISGHEPCSAPTSVHAAAAHAAAAQVRTPPPIAPMPPPRAVPAARTGRLQACCWPLGEPGTRSFRFCDAESLAGKPYCGEHAQLAYVRVRDRRDEAA